MLKRCFGTASAALAGVLLLAGHAAAVDFEGLPAGHILTNADFPAGTTLLVENDAVGHPNKAIIFDSDCTVATCSGSDPDLRTPGDGFGNDGGTFGNIMIIAERCQETVPGICDDPDDEFAGGTIILRFAEPYKLLSLYVTDIEAGETPVQVELDNVDGSDDVVPIPTPGDNSLVKINIPDPKPTTEIRLVHAGSGGWDELDLVPACGDSVLDFGEDCDPPASLGGDPLCLDGCILEEEGDPVCGDEIVQEPEECDPPASAGGDADCNDDCTRADCGNDVVEAGEDCDPPASMGGDADCDEFCQRVPLNCGDFLVMPPEECDPPASQGGSEMCNDDCMLSVCGDSEIGAGEECDAPASQGGDMKCNDDCTLSICGDSMIEAGEACDPPESMGGVPGCNDDCTMAVCGNDDIESGEECDPPASMGGDPMCNDDCTLSICGDSMIEAGEDCDPPASMGGDPMCSDMCKFPECGNGIVEEGEECDPPGAQGGDLECNNDCTLAVCGDGIVEGSEECDPPDAEICDNGIDDNNNNLIDCVDPICNSEEARLMGVCTPECKEVLSLCSPIRNDPARIRFGNDGDPDKFWLHGRIEMPKDAMNPVEQRFGIMIENAQGVVFAAFLEEGDVQPSRASPGKRFFFVDKTAKRSAGIRGGIYRFSVLMRKIKGTEYAAVRIRAYGDFSRATLPRMTTQIYGLKEVGFLTADWTEKKRGWILRQRDF
jgi:hypothetical protein